MASYSNSMNQNCSNLTNKVEADNLIEDLNKIFPTINHIFNKTYFQIKKLKWGFSFSFLKNNFRIFLIFDVLALHNAIILYISKTDSLFNFIIS